MVDSQRVVVTGLGVLSPIGSTPSEFWQSLKEGRSGLRRFQHFDPSPLPCQIGGEIPDFNPKALIEKSYRKALNAMSRPVQLGTIAAQLCMQEAGLTKGSVAPDRLGVEFASVMAATELADFARASKLSANPDPKSINMARWGREGLKEIPPLWMLKYLPNMPACHISILYDAQGPSNTLISGETAGLLCFSEAFRILRRGLADVMIVGGSDSKLNPLSMSRFSVFAPLTKNNENPAQAIRPYDLERDGTALGEGGVVFTLERLDHARRRGARILSEVVGYASGMDKGLSGSGLARVIEHALARAAISPADVDHINAHGSGVVAHDVFEARGIAEVFGREVPVYAPLPAFGSLSAAAAIIETAASVLAFRHGLLPGTLNHHKPDPACPIRVHTGEPRPIAKPYAVKLAYTDLGQCAALVIKQWSEN